MADGELQRGDWPEPGNEKMRSGVPRMALPYTRMSYSQSPPLLALTNGDDTKTQDSAGSFTSPPAGSFMSPLKKQLALMAGNDANESKKPDEIPIVVKVPAAPKVSDKDIVDVVAVGADIKDAMAKRMTETAKKKRKKKGMTTSSRSRTR